MKLKLLYVDELRGFYKSKVMLFLWIGLPIVALLFRLVQVSTTGQAIPFTVVSALIVSSLAGTLAAVMLTVSIINEKNRHVYELFLIRPLKRRDIMLSKFLSVYTCVAIASLIAIFVGVAADYFTSGALSATVFKDTAQSLAISLSMVAVACSAGVLIGVRAIGARRSHTGHLRRKPNIRHPACSHIAQPASSRPIHCRLSGDHNDCPPHSSRRLI
jgi:ABC-type Na+ efflux pump permease subunit